MATEMVATTLRKEGYTNLSVFHSAQQGWDTLNSALASRSGEVSDEIVICDWNMPGISGLDFLSRLKAHPRAQNVPLIMISGDLPRSRVKEALSAGVSSVLAKPFDFNRLHCAFELAWGWSQKVKGQKEGPK